MRQSQLFGKTLRAAPKDEVAESAKLLIRGGFIHKLFSGVYSYLPLGFRVFMKIEGIIREEMNAIGGQEILMPALQPRSLWEETGRWQGMGEVMYRLKDRIGKDLSLGPTHEEVVTDIVRSRSLSYKDLPFSLYQIQTKFRDEPRAKSGLIRAREFAMKDLYSFHAGEKDLAQYYKKVITAYKKIFKRCGLDTIVTEASGGVFSKEFSHEFQVPTPRGEDTVIVCAKGHFARNKEIASGDTCPICGGLLEQKKTVEAGNIFKLGTKFSHSMRANFRDKAGEEQPVVMGCYGIGLGRFLATIVEVHHDKDGIAWPREVTPFVVHLVELSGKGRRVHTKALLLYQTLQRVGLEVLWDDRDEGAGVKFKDADLMGIPVRLVVSEKTRTKVEWKERGSKKAVLLSATEVVRRLRQK